MRVGSTLKNICVRRREEAPGEVSCSLWSGLELSDPAGAPKQSFLRDLDLGPEVPVLLADL